MTNYNTLFADREQITKKSMAFPTIQLEAGTLQAGLMDFYCRCINLFMDDDKVIKNKSYLKIAIGFG